MMKRLVPLLLTLLLAACGQDDPLLTQLNGQQHHLSDYRGKWVLINYWAPWCGPCLKEIPELNAFYREHKRDAVVLGFNYDQPERADLLKAIKKLNVAYPNIIQDPANQLGVRPIMTLPTSLLISPTGQVKEILLGAQTRKTLEVAMHIAGKLSPKGIHHG